MQTQPFIKTAWISQFDFFHCFNFFVLIYQPTTAHLAGPVNSTNNTNHEINHFNSLYTIYSNESLFSCYILLLHKFGSRFLKKSNTLLCALFVYWLDYMRQKKQNLYEYIEKPLKKLKRVISLEVSKYALHRFWRKITSVSSFSYHT